MNKLLIAVYLVALSTVAEATPIQFEFEGLWRSNGSIPYNGYLVFDADLGASVDPRFGGFSSVGPEYGISLDTPDGMYSAFGNQVSLFWNAGSLAGTSQLWITVSGVSLRFTGDPCNQLNPTCRDTMLGVLRYGYDQNTIMFGQFRGDIMGDQTSIGPFTPIPDEDIGFMRAMSMSEEVPVVVVAHSPEPASLILFGTGLTWLAIRMRRRKFNER